MLGVAEPFMPASFVAAGFSVVDDDAHLRDRRAPAAALYGCLALCRGVRRRHPVLALEDGGAAAASRKPDQGGRAQGMARDRSGAIVLGCAGMPGCARRCRRVWACRSSTGVAAAVRFAEALAGLGLHASNGSDYAPVAQAIMSAGRRRWAGERAQVRSPVGRKNPGSALSLIAQARSQDRSMLTTFTCRDFQELSGRAALPLGP